MRKLKILILLLLPLLTACFQNNQPQTPDEKIKQVAVTRKPSIVLITTDPNEEDDKLVLGSGVVLTKDGYIITCTHLANSSRSFIVRFPNNPDLVVARRVAYFDDVDLAIIKVETTDAIPVKVAMDSNIEVTDRVVLIGNPRGQLWTVSAGRVTGLRNTNKGKVVQMDATASAGASGGGLFDLDGELIGVFSFKVVGSSSSLDGEINMAISTREFLGNRKHPSIWEVIRLHREMTDRTGVRELSKDEVNNLEILRRITEEIFGKS